MQHTKSNIWEKVSVGLLVVIIAILIGGVWWYFHRPATTVVATCSASNLSLSTGHPDGTAGTIYWHATVTNNGTSDCTLTGYPAAFMSDATTLSIGAQSNSLYSPEVVTLAASGGKAHAVIGLPEAGNFPDTVTCTVAASSTLHLYLPGVATPLSTALHQSACPSYTVTALQSGE